MNGRGDEVDQLVVVRLTTLRQSLRERQRAFESALSIASSRVMDSPLTPPDHAFRHDLDFLALDLLPVCPLLLCPGHPDPSTQKHLAQDGDRADLAFRFVSGSNMDGETQRRNDRIVVHVARLRVNDHRYLVQVD